MKVTKIRSKLIFPEALRTIINARTCAYQSILFFFFFFFGGGGRTAGHFCFSMFTKKGYAHTRIKWKCAYICIFVCLCKRSSMYARKGVPDTMQNVMPVLVALVSSFHTGIRGLKSHRDTCPIIIFNQLMQLRTARTAWSDSDQAVRAVHSCNSW